MSVLVDAHVHIFESKELGQQWKDSYSIWEYGAKPNVMYSPYRGDFKDIVAAMEQSGYAHTVFLNIFFAQIELDFAVAALGPEASQEEKEETLQAVKGQLPELMYQRNRWGCDLVRNDSRFSVLAAVDPTVVAPEENVAMIREFVESDGIKGIKIHPTIQRFWPDTPAMLPVWEVCEELELIVLTHSGSTQGGEQFAAPSALAPVLRRFPRLKLQVAHLGGGRWKETVTLADEFPQAFFDLCEIIEWIGAPQAPSSVELGEMIRSIGIERVLMGSDFPWYDLDRTASLVDEIRGISEGEKEMIMGGNASRMYQLGL